jgi:S-adenosylmethionine-dependent methyltransferase
LRERQVTKMTTTAGAEQFQSGAEKYAAYLETPAGRLRVDLPLANLGEFLPPGERSLCALDIGGGTGANAVRLARLGLHVTLLDLSPAMLEIAERAAHAAGVGEKIALRTGDATQLADLFQAGSFDLIVCHNVLEFVDEPCVVLRDAALALRNSSSIISILVRNRPGEVLKAALLQGDLAAAERNLTSEWGDESLYGGKVRLFTEEILHAALEAASLVVTATRGVRVLADYLPQRISRSAQYEEVFELERELGRRLEFAGIARYTHCLAHRAEAGAKGST